MKHLQTTISMLFFGVMLTASLPLHSQTIGMPKGEMISYSYTRGGGMNPLDFTIFAIRYVEDENKWKLTVSGDCPGENFTFEVGPEVMEQCRSLVEKHKLYLSRGFYKPEFIVHDAPSAYFSVTFRKPYTSISGSGDIPKNIREGISAVNKYLRSLAGDRKAEGHVDRVYNADSIAGMHWTDGYRKVTTPENSEKPLKLAVRQLSDSTATINDLSKMGFTRFRDGDRHFFVIHDYKYDVTRIFFSFDGKEQTLNSMRKLDEASLLRGAFTDDEGHRYLFTSDWMVQEDGNAPKQFLYYDAQGGQRPVIIFKGEQMRDFKVTEQGVDFFGLKRPGDRDGKDPFCSLTRVADDKEWWPVVNERFLSQPMIDCLSDTQLEQMSMSIRMYPIHPEGGLSKFSDIGEVNQELIDRDSAKRKK